MKALVLQLRYLTGRCVATAYNDRDLAEWPPHPARVYSALVATWAEEEVRDEAERAALEWLAKLAAPRIYATGASHRDVVPHFVPVNDAGVLGTFERERERFRKLEDALAVAKEAEASARRAGDEKGVTKATKTVAKAEKVLADERVKVKGLIEDDQRPYSAGKHSGVSLKGAWALLPEHRGRQPRSFPSVSPDDSRVFLRWTATADDLEQHGPALGALATRVIRIGHSASLVACAVCDDCPTPTWEPRDDGDEVLRIPGPNQLELLLEAHSRHQEIEPRVLPCRFQRYVRVGSRLQPAPVISAFGDDWLVFRQVGGRRLAQTSCVEIARAMRGALLKHADDPPPQLLSGHAAGGEQSEVPHLAIVPLPFVGHAHATGDLLGVALILPRDSDAKERQAVLRAIGLWEDARRLETDDDQVDTPPLMLVLGRAGEVVLERVEWGTSALRTLGPATWRGPSHSWVTATPIALDRNPGNLYSREPAEAAAAFEAAERSIATSCERIGLPLPSYVQVHPSVPLVGAVKARTYPPFPTDPKKHQRVKVHARIEFPVPVAGPVLLGAGRYYGLGLCCPVSEKTRVQP